MNDRNKITEEYDRLTCILSIMFIPIFMLTIMWCLMCVTTCSDILGDVNSTIMYAWQCILFITTVLFIGFFATIIVRRAHLKKQIYG